MWQAQQAALKRADSIKSRRANRPRPTPATQPVETRWGGDFGTRSQIIVACWADGRGELRERFLEGGEWCTVGHAFEVLPLRQQHRANGSGGSGDSSAGGRSAASSRGDLGLEPL